MAIIRHYVRCCGGFRWLPTQSTTPFVLPTLQQFAKRNSTFSFASVAEQANQLVSAGGRLYTASYSAETLGRASQQVYRI
ncbi:hypothetical protein [Latilactobacillus curvatus]|uniref:hypothetical protein n=1 Tax=Latilactobacillus curvatus TaxID=28038 RepID=UPI0020A507EB|nr:hypothetical protein [Latilactobacillus curvatus]UTC11865.1 hypothetical protein A4W75_01750 [Latilactobacillus curvatus]